jgi:hypothetical protein
LLTRMTGNSLHMQWPLTSQLHGSVSQREQLVFRYGSNSTPYFLNSFKGRGANSGSVVFSFIFPSLFRADTAAPQSITCIIFHKKYSACHH